MPSRASTVGRVLHRCETEVDALEKELAQEVSGLIARLDREHIDAVADARAAAGRAAPAGGRQPIPVPKEGAHIAARDAALAKLNDRHTPRRKALRDRHVKELAAARATPSTPGKHQVPSVPERHHSISLIWNDLNGARASAVHGVMQKFARLRDDADADNVSNVERAGRYMKAGRGTAEESQSRHERAHYDITRREFDELRGLTVRFAAELERERRRFMEQAQERRDMERRHTAANAGYR